MYELNIVIKVIFGKATKLNKCEKNKVNLYRLVQKKNRLDLAAATALFTVGLSLEQDP